ncbi:hypothetical protein GHT06_006378 [Daphnia sinensis]|uniref:RNA-directed DNA polymerase n=1 Tax=Daphnia sinensis TaxID=1820382 RepID=A0AAD5L534_9CRUS|nr:hypothetical protein GHT06_006378 [Daphnia sinensis]
MIDDLIFELQYLLRNDKKIELSNKEVGTALRALLLTEPTILTPIQLFMHCGLKSFYENTDSEYESVHSEEQQDSLESDLAPQLARTLEKTEEETPRKNAHTKTLTLTPCNYLPHQGLQSRKVSFTPTSTVNQSKTVQNKPLEPKDMSVKIYIKELSRLMESGMDYEEAYKAADCIVQHVLTNTKRCTKPSMVTYLTSTPLQTQPFVTSEQSVKSPEMFSKKSNNGATPKYLVTNSISNKNPLLMTPSKVNGLSFDVQTRLKYKEFESFEKLIEKAEMTAMAVEEAQVRSRLNAFQAKYAEPNKELIKVKEALDRLSTKVESNSHQKHLEENMEKMQRQLSKRRNVKPILIYPDFSKEFLIYTDASNYGLGAVLSQMKDGKDQPIAYASRHLNKGEIKYSTIEKEAVAVVFGIKRFRHYLQDQPFIIVSDHRPLQWLQTFKDETGRLGRWAILLSNMKFSVQYRPGRVHENADFLSRIPMNLISVTPEDNNVMCQEQQKDSLCKAIVTFLEQNEPWKKEYGPMPSWVSEIDYFFIEDGLLCKHYESTSAKRRNFEQCQVVVPFSLRKQLLQEYHDSPLSGHMATRRTFLRLRDKYYWPTMLRDVKEYCTSCEPCALGRRVHRAKAHLNPLDLATKPFEVLALNIKRMKTTAYHPQTNGQTKRFNKTVVEMIRKYLENGFERWEDILGPVVFAYNNSVHSSTLETPYFLNHGRDPVMPIDQFLRPLPPVIITPSDYKSQIMKRLHEAFQLVKSNLSQAREQQKTQYDKRVKEQKSFSNFESKQQ